MRCHRSFFILILVEKPLRASKSGGGTQSLHYILDSYKDAQKQISACDFLTIQVLRWTSNPATATTLSWELAALLAAELEKLSEPCPGVREWVASLSKYKVPVAIVSELDKFTVRLALQRMHLDDHFTVGPGAAQTNRSSCSSYTSAGRRVHIHVCRCAARTVTSSMPLHTFQGQPVSSEDR